MRSAELYGFAFTKYNIKLNKNSKIYEFLKNMNLELTIDESHSVASTSANGLFMAAVEI